MTAEDKLTMGARMAMTNIRGEIVLQLYMLPDGCLHPDSWLSSEGWK